MQKAKQKYYYSGLGGSFRNLSSAATHTTESWWHVDLSECEHLNWIGGGLSHHSLLLQRRSEWFQLRSKFNSFPQLIGISHINCKVSLSMCVHYGNECVDALTRSGLDWIMGCTHQLLLCLIRQVQSFDFENHFGAGYFFSLGWVKNILVLLISAMECGRLEHSDLY